MLYRHNMWGQNKPSFCSLIIEAILEFPWIFFMEVFKIRNPHPLIAGMLMRPSPEAVLEEPLWSFIGQENRVTLVATTGWPDFLDLEDQEGDWRTTNPRWISHYDKNLSSSVVQQQSGSSFVLFCFAQYKQIVSFVGVLNESTHYSPANCLSSDNLSSFATSHIWSGRGSEAPFSLLTLLMAKLSKMATVPDLL